MSIHVKHKTIRLGNYDTLLQDRSGFQRFFSGQLLKEPGIHGRVLDIGCGGNLPSALSPIVSAVGQLDGVDPNREVLSHPHLTRRWHDRFEEADIPTATYDMAYAYNVVEHIEQPEPFFQKVRAILKPGGCFWALTPHAKHPFCKLARWVELAGGKRLAGRAIEGVNDYSSYYRLNSAAQVLGVIQGYSTAKFYYLPSLLSGC